MNVSTQASSTPLKGIARHPLGTYASVAFRSAWHNVGHRDDDGSRALVKSAIEMLVRASETDKKPVFAGSELPQLTWKSRRLVDELCELAKQARLQKWGEEELFTALKDRLL